MKEMQKGTTFTLQPDIARDRWGRGRCIERERERGLYQHEIVVTTRLLGSNIILVNYVAPKHHRTAQEKGNSTKITAEKPASELHQLAKRKKRNLLEKISERRDQRGGL